MLDVVTAAAPFDMVPQVRNILGAFLFSGGRVDKPVGVLSGGERNRLALAILLLRPTNCLLLDEPTNHLDLAAKEVLLEALLSYAGTLVFVAHDRYFLDRLPDEVIEVGRGRACTTSATTKIICGARRSKRTAVLSTPLAERGPTCAHAEASAQTARSAIARRRSALARAEARKRASERLAWRRRSPRRKRISPR